MRPPDDLNTIKFLPFTGAAFGAGVIPLMWIVVFDFRELLALSVCVGLFFMAGGLYVKYRARYSPSETIWALPFAVVFFGSLLVGASTLTVHYIGRIDLLRMVVGCSLGLVVISILVGWWRESKNLALACAPEDWLSRHVDLEKGLIQPSEPHGLQPSIGMVAFVSAAGLNLPLLMELGGWDRNSVVFLLIPLMGGTTAYVLMSALGPGLARAVLLLKLQADNGVGFTTSRIEELRTLRRSFWLAKWLCRPEDLVEAPTSSTQRLTRKDRRRTRAAEASIER